MTGTKLSALEDVIVVISLTCAAKIRRFYECGESARKYMTTNSYNGGHLA